MRSPGLTSRSFHVGRGEVVAEPLVAEVEAACPPDVPAQRNLVEFRGAVVQMERSVGVGALVTRQGVVLHVKRLQPAVVPAPLEPVMHDAARLGAPDRRAIIDR
jgi:hypothetical protein